MKELFLIFLGGGLGSITRFSFGKWINTQHSNLFPFGTFTVNILACFIVGILVGVADSKQIISPLLRLFWIVGFCGGFSTFSTFSNEALLLLQSDNYYTSIFYIIASVLCCLLSTFFGMWLVQKIIIS